MTDATAPQTESPYKFRRGSLSDLDLIVAAAKRAYAFQTVDWDAARTWTQNLLSSPAVTCLIGHRTIGFMLAVQSLWDTKPRAFLLPLFALPAATPGPDLEPLAMVRQFADLARRAGCATLESSTETTHDVGLLLKRLGASSRPLYVLEL